MPEPSSRKPLILEEEPLSGTYRFDTKFSVTPGLHTPASRAPVSPLESKKKRKIAISPFGRFNHNYDSKANKSAVSYKSVERNSEHKESEGASDFIQAPVFLRQAHHRPQAEGIN